MSIKLSCVEILRDGDCEDITNQPRESCEVYIQAGTLPSGPRERKVYIP